MVQGKESCRQVSVVLNLSSRQNTYSIFSWRLTFPLFLSYRLVLLFDSYMTDTDDHLSRPMMGDEAWDLNSLSEEEIDRRLAVYLVPDAPSSSSSNRAEATLPRNLVLKPTSAHGQPNNVSIELSQDWISQAAEDESIENCDSLDTVLYDFEGELNVSSELRRLALINWGSLFRSILLPGRPTKGERLSCSMRDRYLWKICRLCRRLSQQYPWRESTWKRKCNQSSVNNKTLQCCRQERHSDRARQTRDYIMKRTSDWDTRMTLIPRNNQLPPWNSSCELYVTDGWLILIT